MFDTRTQLLIFFYKMSHQITCFTDLLVYIPKHKSEFITGFTTISRSNKHYLERFASRVFFFQSFMLVLLINLGGIFASPEKSHAAQLLPIKSGSNDLLDHLVIFLHAAIAEIGADDVREEVQPEVVAD